MKTRLVLGTLTTTLVAIALVWQLAAPPPVPPAPAGSAATLPPSAAGEEPIQPLPAPPALDPAKIALGEMLFRDPRVSRNNTLACVSCHQIDASGADGLPHSRRMNGELTPLHTPSIFNVGLNFQLFWDGRAKTLEEQIASPRDTETDWREVKLKLRNDREYQLAFARAYPRQGMSEATLKDAVVNFERSLYTPGARFDRYLLGDQHAISDREKTGYQLFKRYGCIACHQGANIGGNMFQKLGVTVDYFGTRKQLDAADYGRYNATQREEDKFVFRVPSLRNVAVTAPYFHDGSIATLHDAITVMAAHQLGRPIPETDIDLIMAFLQTLTGEYRGKPLRSGS